MKHRNWLRAGTGVVLSGLLAVLSLASPARVSAAHTPPPPHLPAKAALVPPAVLASSRAIGPVAPSSPWTFDLLLASRNATGLADYATAVSTPGTASYHRFLSRAQMLRRFGPDPATVHRLTAYLTQRGFQVTASGPVLSVQGTVAQVNQLFSTHLTRFASTQAGRFVAPAGTIGIPSALRAAESVGGLTTSAVRPAPLSKISKAHALTVAHEPIAAMKPAPSGRVGEASSGGFVVTAQLLTKGPRMPGLAVHYLITATEDGQPDPSAAITAVRGTVVGASSFVDSTLTNSAGQFVVDFSLSQAQSAQVALTVGDATHSATVVLPTARFVGPSVTTCQLNLFGFAAGQLPATVCLWNPATNSVNTALHANRLVSQAGPGRLGVYTAGNVASISQADVNLFASQFGLPAPSVSVAYTGPNACTNTSCPGIMPGIEGELSLDLQMMETASPGASIQVFEAGSIRSALAHAVMEPAAMRPNVFSISYGAGDLVIQQFEPGAEQSMDMIAQMANVEGMTVVASAGDSGAFSGAQFGNTTPQPSYPASSSNVTALGGLEAAVTNGQVNQLAMWGGNLGAEIPRGTLLSFLEMENMMASGGYSQVEPAPFYQVGFVPPGMGRGNPDVSLPASVVTPGYFAYLGGIAYPVGGTSAAAPLFAGYVADLANVLHTGLGNVNDVLYPLSRIDPGILAPVAFGNNGVYAVTPRYNAATGLGGLNVDRVMSDLVQLSHPAGPGGPGSPRSHH